MPIFTGGVQARREKLLEEFQAPLLDVLGNVADEALTFSPTSSLKRAAELTAAMEIPKTDLSDVSDRDLTDSLLGDDDDYSIPGPDNGALLSQSEAKQRSHDAGFNLDIPEGGIMERALGIIIERKRDESARQSLNSRAPTGVVPGILKFGTSLLASMVDPLNVASAFIPIIGPTRYARMLARSKNGFGRAGVRARVGAVEGVVGQAVVEPIVLAAAIQEQSDYNLMDSFINIAFGTLLGAGLHTGAGALGDAIRKGRPWQTAKPVGANAERVSSWSPKDRMEISRTALAQALTGRKIDVEPIVEFRDAVAEFRPSSIEEAKQLVISDIMKAYQKRTAPETPGKLSPGEAKALKAERAGVVQELGLLEKSFTTLIKTLQRTKKVSRKQAESRARRQILKQQNELSAKLKNIDERLSGHEIASLKVKEFENLKKGVIPDRMKADVDKQARARFQALRRKPLTVAMEDATKVSTERLARAWRNAKDNALGTGRVVHSELADPEGAAEISKRVSEATDKEFEIETILAEEADILAELRQIEREVGLEETDLKALDDAVDAAKERGELLKAASRCVAGG